MSNRVCHFKLVLLGDAAVGKSCLVVRFVRDEFFEFQEPTIGGKKRTVTRDEFMKAPQKLGSTDGASHYDTSQSVAYCMECDVIVLCLGKERRNSVD